MGTFQSNISQLHEHSLTIFKELFLIFKIFIYLGVLGLSCGIWDLVP